MDKVCLYPGVSSGGSPRIHLVEPGSAYGMGETSGLEKTASCEHLPEVLQLVESIQAQPDRLYLLNSSLAAQEVSGLNLRGDSFPEKGLCHTPPGWDDIPLWDIDARRKAALHKEEVPGWGKLSWGFPTFYNAHKFRHHRNKDPNRAYGYVLGAFWDPRMKRVILVSELIRSKCEDNGAVDLYDRIAAGEFVDTSMGSKVPFDRCLICGHIARSPATYCEHVKRDARFPYGMRKLLEDGRRCGVANDYPRFFDDSYVLRGAERTAKNMTDLTSMVQGDNAYTQEVYSCSHGSKMASTPTDAEEAVDAIARSASRIFGPEDGPGTVDDQMERVLSGLPALTSKQRAAAKQMLRQKGKRKKLSKNSRAIQASVDRIQVMQETGISKDDARYLDYLIRNRQRTMRAATKTASTKSGEMIKRVESTDDTRVTNHVKTLPSLSKCQLDSLAERPGSRISAAARLGIVLTPREFMYTLLRKGHPKEAQQLWDAKAVFVSKKVDTTKEAEYAPPRFMAAESKSVVDILGPSLLERSFAPGPVRARIMKTAEVPTPALLTEQSSPLLDEVADLYNQYRQGLLNTDLCWQDVEAPVTLATHLTHETKLASAVQDLSNDLLLLAYWPALTIRSATESPAEKATGLS